jgi:hypothetical protein
MSQVTSVPVQLTTAVHELFPVHEISVFCVALLVMDPVQLLFPEQLTMNVAPPLKSKPPVQLLLPQLIVQFPPPCSATDPVHTLFPEQSSTHELPEAQVKVPLPPGVTAPPGAQLLPLIDEGGGSPIPPMHTPVVQPGPPPAGQLYWLSHPLLTTPHVLAPHAVPLETGLQAPEPH